MKLLTSFTHRAFIHTHRNWNVWRSLSNYHAKSPDLSPTLSDVTLSVLVTKVSLVEAEPTLVKLAAPI